jgi:predicted PurR-regulated permease PerM/methylmalonyl-CoA mutase cobalamin-binding subunit
MPALLVKLAGAVLVAACLYWAQAVILPVALAALLTFLLVPPVVFLQHRGVPRPLAVLVVVLLALGTIGAVGTALAMQVTGLAAEMPRYKDNIREKISDIRLLGRTSGLQPAQETVQRAAGEVEREVERRKPADVKREKATPVVIHEDRSQGLWGPIGSLSPWIEPLSRAGLVALLVPFMLTGREELRNRLFHLLGVGRMGVTTRALDEAGGRVARYLITQGAVNASLGTLVAIGLFLVGVPYALLFGFFAAVLRFIPYVGIWLAAGMPAVAALAVFPGWTKALLVIGLFVVLEAFTAGVLEVLLYARSAGVSEVGLLVAIAFWTWVWGPIGLILATPLTVCLVVVAKYVPQIEFLWVLMGDEPVVTPHLLLYQRLLAEDHDEAAEAVEGWLAEHPPERLGDDVVVPALLQAGGDRARGRIDDAEERGVVRAAREIVEDVAGPPAPAADGLAFVVLGTAARSDADEVALLMLRDLLARARVAMEVAPGTLLPAELVQRAAERDADVVVVVSLAPGGLAQARYRVKQLRAARPALRIIVGRYGAPEDMDAMRSALTAAGADGVGTTLLETRDLVAQLAPARTAPASDRAA